MKKIEKLAASCSKLIHADPSHFPAFITLLCSRRGMLSQHRLLPPHVTHSEHFFPPNPFGAFTCKHLPFFWYLIKKSSLSSSQHIFFLREILTFSLHFFF